MSPKPITENTLFYGDNLGIVRDNIESESIDLIYLASLETVYRELIPQLNLRQWSSSIYSWLIQPVLDPANSGCVTMDYLMKLVTTALEWTYQARELDIRAETLEQAASLLVLGKDTLRIIDGAGPGVEAEQANETRAERVSSQSGAQKIPLISPKEHTTQAHPKSGVQAEPNQSAKCTFFGGVPINIQRFEESGVSLVECPDCGRTWTLSPRGGVLRFKSHDKRKTNTLNTGRRWARGKGEKDWNVVGAHISHLFLKKCVFLLAPTERFTSKIASL